MRGPTALIAGECAVYGLIFHEYAGAVAGKMAFKRANSSFGEGRRRKKRRQKQGAADFENSHIENSIQGRGFYSRRPDPQSAG
jgi:hypothetical protein